MIQIEIPGTRPLELGHLLLDLNSIVALDGDPMTGVGDQVAVLAVHLSVHLVTADHHGPAEETSRRLGCHLVRVEPRYEASQKGVLVERLGAAQVVAVGSAANDAQMLSAAALGIAVLARQGLAVGALRVADLVVGCTEDALALLLHSLSLASTLRH